jgi:hypothetical protein
MEMAMSDEPELTRRAFTGAFAAFGALTVLGCSDGARSQAPDAAPTAAAVDTPRQMIVYRDPSCPCCEKWAALAQGAGYRVRVVDHPDMPSIKRQYGVPDELASCHTGVIGDYALEGHVPFEHIARLLRDPPEGVIGLAVAGMPAGSPGMEVPGGPNDEFEVMAFDKSGKFAPFTARADA